VAEKEKGQALLKNNSADMTEEDLKQVENLITAYQRITSELSKAIVGQTEVIEQVLIAILARGHCLLEGVPGLAKTLLVRSLAKAMKLTFRRIQFTPDLMPADITGTDIIQEDPTDGRRRLMFLKGPIFAQMILADEINRTPPKTQAALLEAMQEQSVTIGGRTYQLDQPFFVLATQNPIEQEGTYPLPEAQRDRFLFHIKVGYPNRDEERLILQRTTAAAEATLEAVIDGPSIIACQKIARKVPVPDHVMEFVLDLARKCRPKEAEALPFVKEWVEWGPGPRVGQTLILGGKVRALLHNRFRVAIEDIEALTLPAMRHRIVPTFNAEAEGQSVDTIIQRVLASVPRPRAKTAL